jgi:hypothetical protein
MLARRLLFTATEGEYERLAVLTFEEFEDVVGKQLPTRNGIQVFCRIFGLAIDDQNHVSVVDRDCFRKQALWGGRFPNGVAACTNHVEGLHARLNDQTQLRHILPRKFALLVELLRKKAKKFDGAVFQAAKKKLAELTKTNREIPEQPTCDCGWSEIYSKRYEIANFPCSHTCGRHLVSIPPIEPIDMDWKYGTRVAVTDYDGEQWKCKNGKDAKHVAHPVEQENPGYLIEGHGWFVNQLHFELSLTFDHYHLTPIDLATDLGAFIIQWTKNPLRGDGSELSLPGLRTEFELKWFSALSGRG